MIIVDTALRRRAAEGHPVRVALVGAGFMGRGLATQIMNSAPGHGAGRGLQPHLSHAERAYREAGVQEWRVIADGDALDKAVADGVPAVTDDYRAVCDASSVDVVVEVTGAVEFGCHVVLGAIEHGKHVVLMNAEVDATVGPLLARGRPTPASSSAAVDGDQPGVQMNLRPLRARHRADPAGLRQHQGTAGPVPHPHHPGRRSPRGGARTRTW